MAVIERRTTRTDKALVDTLAQFGVATIHEAQGRKGLLAAHMRPIQSGIRIGGTAVTVEVAPCDNWMIHFGIEECRPGDILVVAPSSPSDAGYFGDLLACSLQARGVLGLVIEAGVRDVSTLRDMAFPVWSRAVSAQGTVKETLGSVNLPLVCAGQIVEPGDVIVADDDGVVVVKRDEAAEVARLSLAREEKEADIRRRLKAGELTLDILGLRAPALAKGLTYRDAE
jgi:4-hydroxy-4-methyl-2-oxoglutarate aldolase